MISSPSSSSFCSARSFKSGCNSNRDIACVKGDFSYADVVRGSPKWVELVHTSDGDISSDDDMLYANLVQVNPKSIRTILPIPSFCTDGRLTNDVVTNCGKSGNNDVIILVDLICPVDNVVVKVVISDITRENEVDSVCNVNKGNIA